MRDDAEGIARICAAGWRDTYRGLRTPEEIEAAIAEYYGVDRIRREIAAQEGWDGWVARSRTVWSSAQEGAA